MKTLKYSLIWAFLFVIIGMYSANATILYNVTTYNSNDYIGYSAVASTKQGQSIIGNGEELNKITFGYYKVGTPTTNINLSLISGNCSNSTTYLSTGSIDKALVTGTTMATANNLTAIMSPYTLTLGQEYCIVIERSDSTTSTTDVHLITLNSATNQYLNGTSFYKNPGWISRNYDFSGNIQTNVCNTLENRIANGCLNFTNTEFYNGAVTATKTIQINSTHIAVDYIAATDINLKICLLNGTSCNTATNLGGAVSTDMFLNTNANEIIVIRASGTNGHYWRTYLNGTTIGGPYLFNTGSTNYVSAVQINSTDFGIAFQDTADTSDGTLVICKLNGSSCGTEQDFITAQTPTYIKVIKGSDNKYKLAWYSSAGYSLIDSFNNFNYSNGLTEGFINNAVTSYIDMIEGSDNKLKIVFRDDADTNKGKFISCNLDGTSCGSEITIYNSRADYNNILENNNKLFYAFNDGSTGALKSINFNLTGGNISSASLFDTSTGEYVNQIFTTANRLLISYGASSKGRFALSEAFTSSVTPVLTFSNISLINNTYFNTSTIQINTSVLNTSTNGNVNQSYIIKYNNDSWLTNDLIVSNELKAYYQAENNANDRLGVYNGTTTNVLYTSSINYNYLNAFSFLGNGYVTIPIIPNLNNSNQFSITGWIKSNNYSSINNQPIFTSKTGWSTGSIIITTKTTGNIEFSINGLSDTTVVSTNTITPNTWYFITAIKNSTHICIGINNVLNCDASTGLTGSNSGSSYIGGNYAGIYYNGSIDEFRVYNKVLNTTEINSLYTTTPYSIYQYATNSLNGTATISNLTDNTYKISFYARNNETNVTSSNYSFTIDTTLPVINNNILSEYNYYTNNNLNSSCSDTNLVSCNISMNSQNKLLNQTFNFTTNGNQSYNITALDLAGNSVTTSGITLVNPYFNITFLNSTGSLITNFSINGTNYNNSFSEPYYNYGLGNKTFTFSKDGFIDTNFTITLNTTNQINTSFVIGGAYIIIKIYDITTGTFITPNNYSIFFLNLNDSISQLYPITNNNGVNFSNLYSSEKSIQISLFNSTNSLLISRETVSPRENTTIILYLNPNNQSLYTKTFEILTADLIQIPNTDVYFYVNIQNTNTFVLQSIKRTNVEGSLTYDVVPNSFIYNICNIYNGVQKCLEQVIFDTTTTNYQLIHDSELNTSVPVTVNQNIIWSFDEDKSINQSNMTFTFEDTNLIVSVFGFNVSRYTNDTLTNSYSETLASYEGQIVQSYTLSQDQYLVYTFWYTANGETYILKTFKSKYQNQFITDIKNLGILNWIFLIVIFILIGTLLESFKDKLFYSVGFLGGTAIIYMLQSYLNTEFVLMSIWSILVINHLLYWYVNTES